MPNGHLQRTAFPRVNDPREYKMEAMTSFIILRSHTLSHLGGGGASAQGVNTQGFLRTQWGYIGDWLSHLTNNDYLLEDPMVGGNSLVLEHLLSPAIRWEKWGAKHELRVNSVENPWRIPERWGRGRHWGLITHYIPRARFPGREI